MVDFTVDFRPLSVDFGGNKVVFLRIDDNDTEHVSALSSFCFPVRQNGIPPSLVFLLVYLPSCLCDQPSSHDTDLSPSQVMDWLKPNE